MRTFTRITVFDLDSPDRADAISLRVFGPDTITYLQRIPLLLLHWCIRFWAILDLNLHQPLLVIHLPLLVVSALKNFRDSPIGVFFTGIVVQSKAEEPITCGSGLWAKTTAARVTTIVLRMMVKSRHVIMMV